MKARLLLTTSVMVLFVTTGFAQQRGVYISTSANPSSSDIKDYTVKRPVPLNESQIDPLVNEYIQQTMYQATFQTTLKSISLMLENSDEGLFPQLIEQAAHQITVQFYKHASFNEFRNDIYIRAKQMIDAQRVDGVSQEMIQENARTQIEEEMKSVVYDSGFQNLVENGLNIALKQQNQIILQESIQQQARQ